MTTGRRGAARLLTASSVEAIPLACLAHQAPAPVTVMTDVMRTGGVGMLRHLVLVVPTLVGLAGPAAADCYDILGCTDRDRFDRHLDYLGSRRDGPNCRFLQEIRHGILAQNGHCADSSDDAAGPDACRAVDADRVRLSPIERANIAVIRRVEREKGCGG